mmetsp:Transcript_113372/g.315607  ORF Transcript_113372/g.315607 Transcript_113372/m.315607 type:complete len:210 (-) Transcript_113372:184-813(-)
MLATAATETVWYPLTLHRRPTQPMAADMTTRPAFLSKPPGKKAALRPPLLPRRVTTPHAKATATKSLNAITIGGGTSLTFRDMKFMRAPKNAAPTGRSAAVAVQPAGGARGLFTSSAPVTQRASCNGHMRGILSPRARRVSTTKNSGETATTQTTTSPSGKQERSPPQRQAMKATYASPRSTNCAATFGLGGGKREAAHKVALSMKSKA